MVAISNSTLRQNVYETIYDLLKAEEGSYGASTSVTVTGAYIDDDNAFPQVVINPVMVSKSEFTFGRATDNSIKDATIVIDLYSRKSKDMDVLSDYIDNLISAQNITGVMLFDSDEAMSVSNIAGNKIHSKTLTYTFRRR